MLKGQVPAVNKMVRFGGGVVAAAAALAGVTVAPAMADGPGSTPLATGPTVGASLLQLPDGNWGVAMGATGFPAGAKIRLVVKVVSQPGTTASKSFDATTSPSTYCPGYAPCMVYPAGSIVPPATIALEYPLASVGGTAQVGVAKCSDSLAAYGETFDGTISSPAVSLTIPACTTGGIGGTGGNGRTPRPLPM